MGALREICSIVVLMEFQNSRSAISLNRDFSGQKVEMDGDESVQGFSC